MKYTKSYIMMDTKEKIRIESIDGIRLLIDTCGYRAADLRFHDRYWHRRHARRRSVLAACAIVAVALVYASLLPPTEYTFLTHNDLTNEERVMGLARMLNNVV